MLPGRFANNSHPDYELIREINRGGMGVVFEIRDRQLNRRFALKLLLSREIDERDILRFEREAQAIAKLRHPNIVGVENLGFEGPVPFMVMDFLEGKDLQVTIEEHLRLNGTVPDFSWTEKTFLMIAEALGRCHEQGIIHRDFKPANVMIAKENGEPILIDFGLVKRDSLLENGGESGPKLSMTGEMIGTPAYMSPEQVEVSHSEPLSTPTDIWSFGVALFFCLTGELPVQAQSSLALYLAILKNEIQPPQNLNPDIPPWLNELCLDCLKKSPSERPTANELYQRLKTGEVEVKKSRSKAVVACFVVLALLCAIVLYQLRVTDSNSAEIQLKSLAEYPSVQFQEEVVIRGKVSRPKASLQVAEQFTTADDAGAFQVTIDLKLGRNSIPIKANKDGV
ncbi:MAG: serine/threonine-protein kinase, partial [Planctomycetota bacterium]|nr:serine/threonine-protein kinase [Planctomycetota bacterium]